MTLHSDTRDFLAISAGALAFNPLRASEKPFDVYAPCWCQSGRKWKFCHKTRQSEDSITFGEIQARAAAARQVWVRDCHTCLHPLASPEACSHGVIDSHTVQRRGGLAAVAENGHVLSPKRGAFDIERNNGEIVPTRIGLRDASTFPGFCNRHDTEMFRPVEQAGANIDHRNAFLLSFRAMGYEYVMKQFSLVNYPVFRDYIDRGTDFRRQVMAQSLLNGLAQGARLAIEDLDRARTRYGDGFTSGNMSSFRTYSITFDTILPFVAAGAFNPEFDFNGTTLQELGTSAEVEQVALNVTVLAGTTVAVFGWWGEQDGPVSRFVDSFANLPENEKATAVATCAFEHLENVYLRESWWNSLSVEEKRMCDERIRGGMVRRSPDALQEREFPQLAATPLQTLDMRVLATGSHPTPESAAD